MSGQRIHISWQGDLDEGIEARQRLDLKLNEKHKKVDCIHKEIRSLFKLKKTQEIVLATIHGREIRKISDISKERRLELLLAYPNKEKILRHNFKTTASFIPHPRAVTNAGDYAYFVAKGEKPLSFAFDEIIDNMISATKSNHRLGLERKIDIYIVPEKDAMSVCFWDNGVGMNADKLRSFCEFAKPPDSRDDPPCTFQPTAYDHYINSNISMFGVGGKQASFFIGDRLTVVTKQRGGHVVEISMCKDEMHSRRDLEQDNIFESKMCGRPAGCLKSSMLPSLGLSQKTIESLVLEETKNDQFTMIIISQVKSEHMGYLKDEFNNLCREISMVYHYYLHGVKGCYSVKSSQKHKSRLDLPKPVKALKNVNITVKWCGNRPQDVDLVRVNDDLESLYRLRAKDQFAFYLIVPVQNEECPYAVVPGFLNYYPRLSNEETLPLPRSVLEEDFADDSENMDENEEEWLRRRNMHHDIFHVFWQGRGIPYTHIKTLPFIKLPRFQQHFVRCRLKGVLFFNNAWNVTKNKLTMQDLNALENAVAVSPCNLKEALRIRKRGKYRQSLDKSESGAITQDFKKWLEYCRRTHDKTIEFVKDSQVKASKRDPKGFLFFTQIKYGKRVFRDGDVVRLFLSANKKKEIWGKIHRFRTKTEAKEKDNDGPMLSSVGDVEFMPLPEIYPAGVHTQPIDRIDKELGKDDSEKQFVKYEEKVLSEWPHSMNIEFYKNDQTREFESFLRPGSSADNPILVPAGFSFPPVGVAVRGRKGSGAGAKVLTAVKNSDGQSTENIQIVQDCRYWDSKTKDFEFDENVNDAQHHVNKKPYTNDSAFHFQKLVLRHPGKCIVLFYIRSYDEEQAPDVRNTYPLCDDIVYHFFVETASPHRLAVPSVPTSLRVGEVFSFSFEILDEYGNADCARRAEFGSALGDACAVRLRHAEFKVSDLELRAATKKNSSLKLSAIISPVGALCLAEPKDFEFELKLSKYDISEILVLKISAGPPRHIRLVGDICFGDIDSKTIRASARLPALCVQMMDTYSGVAVPDRSEIRAMHACRLTCRSEGLKLTLGNQLVKKKKKSPQLNQIRAVFSPDGTAALDAVELNVLNSEVLRKDDAIMECILEVVSDKGVVCDLIDRLSWVMKVAPSEKPSFLTVSSDGSAQSEGVFRARVTTQLKCVVCVLDGGMKQIEGEVPEYELKCSWVDDPVPISESRQLPPIDIPSRISSELSFSGSLFSRLDSAVVLVCEEKFTVEPILDPPHHWTITLEGQIRCGVEFGEGVSVTLRDQHGNELPPDDNTDIGNPTLICDCESSGIWEPKRTGDSWTFPAACVVGPADQNFTFRVEGGGLACPEGCDFTLHTGEPDHIAFQVNGSPHARTHSIDLSVRDAITSLLMVYRDVADNTITSFPSPTAVRITTPSSVSLGESKLHRVCVEIDKRKSARVKDIRVACVDIAACFGLVDISEARTQFGITVLLEAVKGKRRGSKTQWEEEPIAGISPAHLRIDFLPRNRVTELDVSVSRMEKSVAGKQFPNILITIQTEDGRGATSEMAPGFTLSVTDPDGSELTDVYKDCRLDGTFFIFAPIAGAQLLKRAGAYVWRTTYTEKRASLAHLEATEVTVIASATGEVLAGPPHTLGIVCSDDLQTTVLNSAALDERRVASHISVHALDRHGNRVSAPLSTVNLAVVRSGEGAANRDIPGLYYDGPRGESNAMIFESIQLLEGTCGCSGKYELVFTDVGKLLKSCKLEFSFVNNAEELEKARHLQQQIAGLLRKNAKLMKRAEKLFDAEKSAEVKVQEKDHELSKNLSSMIIDYRLRLAGRCEDRKVLGQVFKQIKNEIRQLKNDRANTRIEWRPRDLEKRFATKDDVLGTIGSLVQVETREESRLVSWLLSSNLHSFVVESFQSPSTSELIAASAGFFPLGWNMITEQTLYSMKLPHDRISGDAVPISGNPRFALSLLRPTANFNKHARGSESGASALLFRRIFYNILHETVVLNSRRDAEAYKDLLVKNKIRCGIIVSMDGFRIESNGYCGSKRRMLSESGMMKPQSHGMVACEPTEMTSRFDKLTETELAVRWYAKTARDRIPCVQSLEEAREKASEADLLISEAEKGQAEIDRLKAQLPAGVVVPEEKVSEEEKEDDTAETRIHSNTSPSSSSADMDTEVRKQPNDNSRTRKTRENDENQRRNVRPRIVAPNPFLAADSGKPSSVYSTYSPLPASSYSGHRSSRGLPKNSRSSHSGTVSDTPDIFSRRSSHIRGRPSNTDLRKCAKRARKRVR
eukprot:866382_1